MSHTQIADRISPYLVFTCEIIRTTIGGKSFSLCKIYEYTYNLNVKV